MFTRKELGRTSLGPSMIMIAFISKIRIFDIKKHRGGPRRPPRLPSTLRMLNFTTVSILEDSNLASLTTSPADASPRKPNLGMSTAMALHIPSPHARPHQRCRPNARYSTMHPALPGVLQPRGETKQEWTWGYHVRVEKSGVVIKLYKYKDVDVGSFDVWSMPATSQASLVLCFISLPLVHLSPLS